MIQLGLLFIGWIFLKKCTCHFGALPFKLGMIASTNLIFLLNAYIILNWELQLGLEYLTLDMVFVALWEMFFWHWGVV
jgi:hypothetical protein